MKVENFGVKHIRFILTAMAGGQKNAGKSGCMDIKWVLRRLEERLMHV